VPNGNAPSNRSAFHLGYRPALDGIRGMAVLAVMLYHFGAPSVQGGFLGVDAFFVLSGFLITSLLLEEWSGGGSIDFARFYMKRALRLLPALFAMLLAVAVVALTVAPADLRAAIWRGVLWTLLYAANWQKFFSTASVGMLGHTWSLSIEEQFYVLWPPLLFVLLRRGVGLRPLLAIAAAGAAASAGLRALLMLGGLNTTEALYNGLHTRLDSLLIGCAAALLLATGYAPWPQWPRWARLGAGLALPLGLCVPFAVARLDAARMYYFGLALFACAVAGLILGLATDQIASPILEWRPLVWIGARSYGLYLWHIPVHDTLSLFGVRNWPLLPAAALYMSVSLLLAAASFHCIEAPALSLKRRLAPSRRRALAAVPRYTEPAYGFVRIDS
jgi:peptidoglycan/LPS O-acetylase OafA/YrhL